jgi:uncharacterized protein (UPF0332 family)
LNQQAEDLIRRARRDLTAARANLELGYPEVAASRAYYSMFCVARAFLASEGLSFSSHSAVIAGFGQHFARTKRVPPEYHRFLISGQTLRLEADYEIVTLPESEAREQIGRAERFLEFAERFFSGCS